MSWNNFVEKVKFEREKDKFIKLAKENGMSEENIQEICDYDTAVFHSNRVFYSHNTPLICLKNVENEDYFEAEKKD